MLYPQHRGIHASCIVDPTILLKKKKIDDKCCLPFLSGLFSLAQHDICKIIQTILKTETFTLRLEIFAEIWPKAWLFSSKSCFMVPVKTETTCIFSALARVSLPEAVTISTVQICDHICTFYKWLGRKSTTKNHILHITR